MSAADAAYRAAAALAAAPREPGRDEPRSDELRAAVDNYMGKAHFAYLNGAANGFGAIGKILFGKNTKAYCFLVDDAKLARTVRSP